MQKIYDKKQIKACILKSKYADILESLEIDFYIIKYEKGESVTSFLHDELLFQIVEQGLVNIFFIRDDGTRYSLSNGTTDYFLGDMDLFYPRSNHIYAEAATNLTCLTFSINRYREKILAENSFLKLICNSLSAKIGAITVVEAAHGSLRERVISYMKYKCNDQTLKGIEKAAFHLHCSSRQLQRILNQYEAQNIVKKQGKGTYKLCSY